MAGWRPKRQEHLGWSRSTFFKKMAALEHCGLAKKDPWGNWRLLSVGKVRQKHKCSIVVTPQMSESDIQQLMTLRLFEEGYRQNLRAWNIEDKPRRLRSFLLERQEKEKAGTGINEQAFPDVGEAIMCFVKLAATSKIVPMNTSRLLQATGLSRGSLFAWKRLAKDNGWIEQVNFKTEVPEHYHPSLDYLTRYIEVARRGRVVKQKNKGNVVFVQASCYKPM